MRPTNNIRRSRGRPNRKQQHGSPRHQTFDSHGPDVRIRGNAPQVYEKYLSLARDATSAGDRVAAEGFFQFAEHYFRIMNDSTDPRRSTPPGQAEGRGGADAKSEPESGGGDSAQRNGRPDAATARREPAPLEMEQPFIDPAENGGYWPAADGSKGTAAEGDGEAESGEADGKDAPPRRAARGRGRGRRRPANGNADGQGDRETAGRESKKDDDSGSAEESDGEVVTS